MTRDQFIEKYQDELTGHLHSAMNLVHNVDGGKAYADTEWAKLGRFMRSRNNVARDMLGRIWDSLHPAQALPTPALPAKEAPKPVNGFVPPKGVTR